MPSLRICFLIAAGAALLHVPLTTASLVVAGYIATEWLDKQLARRARSAAIEDELEGWQPDGCEPEYENKGLLTRLRLGGSDQAHRD